VECATPLLHRGAHKNQIVPNFQEQVAQKILTNMGNLYRMPGFSLTLLYLFLVLYARPNRLHREIFYAILSQRTRIGETAHRAPAVNCAGNPDKGSATQIGKCELCDVDLNFQTI
jgi:hypothetical protein